MKITGTSLVKRAAGQSRRSFCGPAKIAAGDRIPTAVRLNGGSALTWTQPRPTMSSDSSPAISHADSRAVVANMGWEGVK